MAGYMQTSERQDWETPTDLLRTLNGIFHFDTDLACSPHNRRCRRGIYPEQDALSLNWGDLGTCFLNPPYGRGLEDWVKACYRHIYYHRNKNLVVMLIPASTETRWYQEDIFPCASDILFLKGRLKFEINGREIGSSPKGSALIFWGEMTDSQRFQLQQANLGKLIHLGNRPTEIQYISVEEAEKALCSVPSAEA